ncbi:MAG: hypothetical protein OXG39_03960 [Chloroflexi bacterium]|nr:hypothetical protein [Chloroflexota bacterium]
MDLKAIVLIALLALIARLGWAVHRRSTRQQPIHGGAPAAIFNFLAGLCFAAILPAVCASVLVLHPDMLQLAGITLSPIIVILVGLALLSLLFSILFALFERRPLERARQETALRDAQGWTEQDAKTSGL